MAFLYNHYYGPGVASWYGVGPGQMMLNKKEMPQDGWVVAMDFRVSNEPGAGNGVDTTARGVIYVGSNRQALGSPEVVEASYDIDIGDYTTLSIWGEEIRVAQGQMVRWGGANIDAQSGSLLYSFFQAVPTAFRPLDFENRDYGGVGDSPPADTLGALDDGWTNEAFSGSCEYIPNARPTTPTWRTPSSNGQTVASTPTLEGYLNQGADAAYDTIDRFQLQIYVLSTGNVVSDLWYNTTSTERNNGYFTRSISGLSSGVTYGAKFKTEDSWGSKSAAFSAERTFTIAAGPNAPTPVSPQTKINAITGTPYIATHSHPTGLSANAAEVIVTNSGGSTLYTSPTTTVSVAPGANISVAEWHSDLAWGTSYQWKMRVRDTNNNWGPYTALVPFSTDAAPNAPTGLSPANNLSTSGLTFTASASDPDGDPVQAAQIEIALVSTGATVSGYPASMTVNSGTGALSYTAPGSGTGSLTLGTAYKWRARANDNLGPGYGAYSEWAFFTYAAVPTVAPLGPMSNRVNMVSQPSAEYDATALGLSNHWTVTAGGTGQSLARLEEDDSPFGAYHYRGVANASGTLQMETTDYITIDGTKALSAFVWAKTISGTPTLTFSVLCYNSSNTLIGGGTLNPQSLAILNATTPATSWTRYGGILMQIGAGFGTAMPTGTVKVKIRVAASGTGTFGVDAFSMGQLPFNPTTTTERDRASEWLGYADGDTVPMGDSESGYAWVGTAGDSQSNILPILTKTASASASVVINYSSPSSSAKSNDRLLIEKWAGNGWVSHYDSNPTWSTANGNRTVIPLPQGVITNEERYRLMVMVRDALLVEGSSDWVEFDVYYTGPAQLDITVAQAIPEKAQVRLAWSPSTLTAEDFAAIEVQRVDPSGEEDTAILDILTNPTDTEYVDHFPAANRGYTYRVRQIQQVGLDQVGSLWSSVSVSCDYYPYSFVKDVEDPTIFTSYETEAQNLVGYEEDAPVGVMTPWGSRRPIVLSRSKLRTKTGNVVGAFLPEAGIEIPGFLDAGTRFDNAARILRRRNTIAVLIPAPEPTKVFAAIMGPARTTFPYPPNVRGWEFTWQEVSFSEDYYARQGIT